MKPKKPHIFLSLGRWRCASQDYVVAGLDPHNAYWNWSWGRIALERVRANKALIDLASAPDYGSKA